MTYQIGIEEVPARTVIAKRHEIPLDAIGAAIGTTFAEIYPWVARSERHPTGEPFVIYERAPAPGSSSWRIEVCVPVSGPMGVPPGCTMDEIPAATVATTIHVGPYAGVGAAYRELERFLLDHELAGAGPPREIYLTEPDVPPDAIRTRIEFPVSRRSGSVGPVHRTSELTPQGVA
jgi:effector-binding domain-containing protein